MSKRKRQIKKKKQTASVIAKRALRLAKANKQSMELKDHVVAMNGQAFDDTTGYILNLTGISQGDGSDDRDGEQIRVTSILCRGKVTIHASATSTQCRLIFFRDRSPQATSPTIAQLLDTPSVQAPLNLTYRKRFKVYWDKYFQLDSNNGPILKLFKFYKKLSIKPVYTGTGAAVTNMMTDHLFIAFLSTEPTNTPNGDFKLRLRYYDA